MKSCFYWGLFFFFFFAFPLQVKYVFIQLGRADARDGEGEGEGAEAFPPLRVYQRSPRWRHLPHLPRNRQDSQRLLLPTVVANTSASRAKSAILVKWWLKSIKCLLKLKDPNRAGRIGNNTFAVKEGSPLVSFHANYLILLLVFLSKLTLEKSGLCTDRSRRSAGCCDSVQWREAQAKTNVRDKRQFNVARTWLNQPVTWPVESWICTRFLNCTFS